MNRAESRKSEALQALADLMAVASEGARMELEQMIEDLRDLDVSEEGMPHG